MIHTRGSRKLILDLCIAVGLCLVGMYEVLVEPLAEDVVRGETWLNVSAVALGTLPLAVRRRLPFWVSLAVYGVIAARAVTDEPLETYPTILAALVATYTVASYASLREALLSGTFCALALALAVVEGSGTDAAPEPLAATILFGTVWLVGRVVGVRNERARTLHEAREQHAAEAVAAERVRIARDLHDAVSHSLAAIVMQSAGARNILDADPQRARASLESIEQVARRGLEEMRRLLGLLGNSVDDREPGPTLERLDELIAAVRATGVVPRLVVEGARPLPAAVDVAAYRVVQESLTNVMKHAGPCTVVITVRHLEKELVIEVSDDGAGAGAGASGGHGLLGMRERVEMLGGRLLAGPRQSGTGYRVRASIPT